MYHLLVFHQLNVKQYPVQIWNQVTVCRWWRASSLSISVFWRSERITCFCTFCRRRAYCDRRHQEIHQVIKSDLLARVTLRIDCTFLARSWRAECSRMQRLVFAWMLCYWVWRTRVVHVTSVFQMVEQIARVEVIHRVKVNILIKHPKNWLPIQRVRLLI